MKIENMALSVIINYGGPLGKQRCLFAELARSSKARYGRALACITRACTVFDRTNTQRVGGPQILAAHWQAGSFLKNTFRLLVDGLQILPAASDWESGSWITITCSRLVGDANIEL